MQKDRKLNKYLEEWANDDDDVQKKIQQIFDKDLQKALKIWERNGEFKVSKTMFKTMTKAKFNRALAKFKAGYKPKATWAKHTKYDL